MKKQSIDEKENMLDLINQILAFFNNELQRLNRTLKTANHDHRIKCYSNAIYFIEQFKDSLT